MTRNLCELGRCMTAGPPNERAWRLCCAKEGAAAAGGMLALQCAMTGLHGSGVGHRHSWLDIEYATVKQHSNTSVDALLLAAVSGRLTQQTGVGRSSLGSLRAHSKACMIPFVRE